MARRFTDILADRFTFHAVDMARFEAHAQTATLQLLKDLEQQITEDLARLDPTATLQTQRRLEALQKAVRHHIQEAYGGIKRADRSRLVELAETVVDSTIQTVNAVAQVSLLNVAVPVATLKALVDDTIVQGAPAAEWWSRQAGNLFQRFSTQIREGVYRGEPLGDLVRRVRGSREFGFRDGIMETTRREAEALIRTSVQSIHNAARLETFERNPDVIKGYQALVTLDNRTTELCQGRSGFAWRLDGSPMTPETDIDFPGHPPWHWGCRTTLIPITYSWAELAKNKDLGRKVQRAVDQLPKSTQASMDGQVAGDLNYEDWLNTKSEEFQQEVLGPARWAMWKDGELTLRDLVDFRGRPLTLEQLRKRAG